MKIAYFRYKDGYLGVTHQSPAGMKGVIFVGRGPREGKGIESVCEQAYPHNCLERLKRVDAAEVPDDWFAAIALENRSPKPTPKPELPPHDPKAEPAPASNHAPKPDARPEAPRLRPAPVYDVRLPSLTTDRGKLHPEVDRFARKWMLVTIIVTILWWFVTRFSP